MRGTWRSKREGFAYIEVLLAILTLGLTMLLVGSAFLPAHLVVKRSLQMEGATQIARAELEHWRQGGFGALPAIASGATSVTQPLVTSLSPLPNPSGQVVFTGVDASLNPVSPAPDRRRVDVTVSWNDTGGDTGTVTLTTLITTR